MGFAWRLQATVSPNMGNGVAHVGVKNGGLGEQRSPKKLFMIWFSKKDIHVN